MRWSNERIQEALDSRFHFVDSLNDDDPKKKLIVETALACKQIMFVIRDEYEKMLPPKENITIGSILAEIRNSKKIGNNELAAKAGIAPSSLSHIENNRRNPSAHSIEAICNALGIDVSYAYKRLEKRRNES